MPMLRLLRAVTLCALLATAAALDAAWFKGNTHAHTINSDGDSSPDTVVRWYKENGYHFVFLTDHDVITRVDGLNATFGGNHFLVLAGQEVTSNFPVPFLRVHVNALNPREPIFARRGANPRETLQLNLDATHAAGALAQINHPNFHWQLKAEDIVAVRGATLLEIRNMHPIMNNDGAGPDFPGTEEMWDRILTAGVRIWGVASDDLHRLKTEGMTPAERRLEALPGRGWIMLRAERLDADAVMAALAAGDFYASTGITLKTLSANRQEIAVEVAPVERYPTQYVITFIGSGGRVLQTVVGTKAVYRIRGDEGYVRAHVRDANGNAAWVQPVMLGEAR